jgi:pyruvate/2-oxoglutarate/acetoin dehydrogenase E1 component
MTDTTPIDRRNGAHLVAATLHQELARDNRILVFGEDVARLGGVFGCTRGLLRDFGPDRVFDTPVSETAFVGAAVGLAQAGYRPVVELMFVDFAGVCFDQILNQLAKNTYMSGARVQLPVVLRTAVGCIGSAAQHSQVLSATFAHVPGLKVVFPGSPGALAGLLVTALRDQNPVVFLEHKWLLKSRIADLPLSDAPAAGGEVAPLPFGRARRVRDGDAAVIVTVGWMVQESLRAADALAPEGIKIAVLDLQTLVPLDRDGLVAEASRAPCLLVVDEDYEAYGMGAEVLACVVEALGAAAPRMARHAVRVPIPASRTLEAQVLPSPASIARAVRELVKG